MGEPSPGGSQTGITRRQRERAARRRGEGWISPQCVPDGAQPQVLTDRYQRGLDRAPRGRGGSPLLLHNEIDCGFIWKVSVEYAFHPLGLQKCNF